MANEERVFPSRNVFCVRLSEAAPVPEAAGARTALLFTASKALVQVSLPPQDASRGVQQDTKPTATVAEGSGPPQHHLSLGSARCLLQPRSVVIIDTYERKSWLHLNYCRVGSPMPFLSFT